MSTYGKEPRDLLVLMRKRAAHYEGLTRAGLSHYCQECRKNSLDGLNMHASAARLTFGELMQGPCQRICTEITAGRCQEEALFMTTAMETMFCCVLGYGNISSVFVSFTEV